MAGKRMARETGSRFAVAALAGMLLGAAAATAEPMTKEACDAAEAERAPMLASGVPESLKKGPAWVKSNLGAAKLKEVERYIELQEKLLFKCGHAKLRTLPVPEGEEGADGLPAAKDAPDEKVAAPPAPPKRKPTAKKPEPRTIEAGVAGNQPGGPAKQPPPPRSKPKPKPDDAYRPPAKAAPATE